jgi:hypothetical protein
VEVARLLVGCINDGGRSSAGGLTGTACKPLLGAERCKGLVLNVRRKGLIKRSGKSEGDERK